MVVQWSEVCEQTEELCKFYRRYCICVVRTQKHMFSVPLTAKIIELSISCIVKLRAYAQKSVHTSAYRHWNPSQARPEVFISSYWDLEANFHHPHELLIYLYI